MQKGKNVFIAATEVKQMLKNFNLPKIFDSERKRISTIVLSLLI